MQTNSIFRMRSDRLFSLIPAVFHSNPDYALSDYRRVGCHSVVWPAFWPVLPFAGGVGLAALPGAFGRPFGRCYPLPGALALRPCRGRLALRAVPLFAAASAL